MILTHADKHKIADELMGTCSTGQSLAEQYEVAVEEIEAAARECEVAKCDQCDWWCETGELNEDDICENCIQ